MKTILNGRFDLHGNEYSRLIKIFIFNKIVPIGNLRGGPGLRCVIILGLLHYFGGILYTVQARYGNKLQLFRRILSKLRSILNFS